MLVAYLIMLREGVEAAMIVGIIAGYLAQTGRAHALPKVWIGVVAALALCVALGVGLWFGSEEFPQKQQEFFEGVVAVIATLILSSMVFWMRKAARSIRGELQSSVDRALSDDRQSLALASMAFLAVGREGLESVFFLLAIAQQSSGLAMPVGAALGLISAVAIGYLIYWGGVKIDLRKFFRWTGVFILFVAAGLIAGAVRAFHEAGLWNGLQQTAFDLSSVLPQDGVVGTLLSGLLGYQDAPTVGELIVYLCFLVPMLALFFRSPRPQPQPRAA